MFDIGWTEIMVIACVAIIVVGPKDLPRMLRTVGQTIGKMRRMSREFQSTFNDALREAEKQADITDMKKQVEDAANFNPLGDLKKSIEETASGKTGSANVASADQAEKDPAPDLEETAESTPPEADAPVETGVNADAEPVKENVKA